MANRDVVLIGFESGLGAQMLDANTGNVIYDTQGRNDTDEIEWVGIVNDEIVTIDYDNHLNIYSKDFVHRLHVELGKSRLAPNGDRLVRRIIPTGTNEFYILSRISDTDPGSTQPYRLQIDRRSWLTGALLETVTTDGDLYDAVNNSSYIEGNGAGLAWDATSVWCYVVGGPRDAQFVRVSLIDGTIIDSFDSTNGGALEHLHNMQYSFIPTADEFVQLVAYVGFDGGGNPVLKVRKIDFTNKVATDAPASCDPLTVNASLEFSGITARTNYRSWVDADNLILKTVLNAQEGSGVSAHMVTLDFTTGTATGVPLDVMQVGNPALPVEGWNMYAFNADATKVALYDEYSGYALYNLIGGSVLARQTYRSGSDTTNDGIYTESFLYITLPEKVISGTVQVAGSGEILPVAIYDQESMQLLRKTTSAADGSYSLGHFSDSPKFVVAAAPDAETNFKVSAHLTGA